jgi:8-oxo-dGTP pyrophosphatase MutT (NUDIX family)
MFADQPDQPAVEAATVMLIRDAPTLEVFLLERHLDSDFIGGAWVFPGGKVDPMDRAIPTQVLAGEPPAPLVAAVGEEVATALVVAAIREMFEEAGVLLAATSDGAVEAHRLRRPSYVKARNELATRGSTWDWTAWLLDEGLRLDLSALAWWSWWVTPRGVHRRFDTKFFVAKLPGYQAPLHDNVETTNSRWMNPAEALNAARSGSVSIILPTRKNLDQLDQYETTGEAMRAAGDPGFERPRIEPSVELGADGRLYVHHATFDRPESV